MACNNLIKIPKNIGNLINLQVLYLNNNNLKKIQKSIGNLINLQYLYLHHNKLIKIPISKNFNKLINSNKIVFDIHSYNKNYYFKNKIIIMPYILKSAHIKKPYKCKIIISEE